VTAAVLALLANTAPVAFGSIGIPVTTLGGLVAPLVGHSKDPQTTVLALSAMVGRQLPLFSVLIPGYLIVVLSGWRRMFQVFPAVAVAGISFAVVQFTVSNFVGPELTDILAALVSLGCLAALLRVWRPSRVWRKRTSTLRPRPSGRGRSAGPPRRLHPSSGAPSSSTGPLESGPPSRRMPSW
jgi:lactate permease